MNDVRKHERIIDVCALGLVAVLPFRAPVHGEHGLRNVLVEQHPEKGVILAATNGHLMGLYYDPNGKTSERWTVNISNEFRRDIKRGTVERVKFDDVHGWSVERRVEMNSMEKDPLPNILFRVEKEHSFPGWKRVVTFGATPCDDGIGILHPKYLGMALESFKGSSNVRMFMSDRYSAPSIFRATGFRDDEFDYSRLCVVVMGMKDDATWKDRIPDWIPK